LIKGLRRRQLLDASAHESALAWQLANTMVSDPRIEQAIEIGRKNKRTWELVRNWCAHVSIRKHGGVGLVEAQTGLPIGHHFLECPHAPAGGMAAWDLADTAVDFYDRNCVGCKFRQPVALMVARGQRAAKLPTIGFLGASTAASWSKWTSAFVQRLGELGWIEGRTVAIEYRWAEASSERAAEIAAEFVRQ
jgi:hypothetical protein